MATSYLRKNVYMCPITLQAQPLQDMENNFINAPNISVFSGYSTRGSGMSWSGFKITSSVESKAWICRAASDGTMYIGIAIRDSSGNWTAYAF